jgi:ketosteroid isomerase-like protein
MSQENVEIVERWIDTANRDGIEIALRFLDSEIEWITTGLFVEPGSYRGHEGVLRYIGDVAAEFEDVHAEPAGLIDAGEQVVLPVRISGRGRQSGAAVDLRLTMLISLRGGMIVRVRNYAEKAEALEAAGLSE